MRNALSTLILIALFAGCGVPKTLRVPESGDSSIIGVSVTTITLLLKHRQDTVYFVKLEEKDENNLGTKVIPSNYQRGSYAYLINAKPGKYAVVGSSFVQSDNIYTSFYNAAAIQDTVIDVPPKQVVFAGRYRIDNQIKNYYRNIERNGDKAQLHYYDLLKNFMYGTFYCGNMRSSDRSPASEREFLSKTRDYFKDSGWLDIINARMEAVKAAQ